MSERATRLFYLGGITRDPGDFFNGVPRRDLDEHEVAALSDEEYAQVTGTPPFAEGSPYSGPLYAETDPRPTGRDGKAAGGGKDGKAGKADATEASGGDGG